MVTFDEFAKMLERSAATCHADLAKDLAEIGLHQQVIAAELIGHELPEFAPLAESTVQQKTALGYVGHVSATDPLLRTGQDRDSIKVEVDPFDLVVAVGSDLEKFKAQELGTAHIPPRPVLAISQNSSLEFAAEKLAERGVRLLTGRKL